MYETLLVRDAGVKTEEKEHTQTATCFAFAGISKSTGSRMWRCGENKDDLEKIALLLRLSSLSKNSDVVLLDNLLNRRESVFLVSPADGIGTAERQPGGSLRVESRGKVFEIPPDNESFYGVFEGL